MELFYCALFVYTLLITKCNGGSLDFHQKSFRVINDHIEVFEINTAFLPRLILKNQKYNRTTRTFGGDFELAKEIGTKLMVNVVSYKLSNSNEYKIFAPLHLSFSACEALRRNHFGLEGVMTHGNITFCPIKKGTYNVDNWTSDVSKLPPLIPLGKYRILFKLIESSELVFSFYWFGSIIK